MGNCVGSDVQRRNQSGEASHLSGTIKNKKAPKLPNNPNQHKLNDLKPILRPSLPSQVVTPSSNPNMKDKIQVIPS